MPRSGTIRLESLSRRKAEFIEPMNCAPVTKLKDGPGWVYEIKLDGYRAVAVKTDGGVNLFSRRRKSFNHHYPLIVEALAELPESTVVDGEVVALEAGRPNFNLLQNFRSGASNIHYFIFDILVTAQQLEYCPCRLSPSAACEHDSLTCSHDPAAKSASEDGR